MYNSIIERFYPSRLPIPFYPVEDQSRNWQRRYRFKCNVMTRVEL